MSRKIKDLTPKFLSSKHYAIGALQNNSSTADVPQRFSQTPVKPVHLSGGDLISNGMKTCNDFLNSSNCHFKVGTTVYFFEVEYTGDEPKYQVIYSGTPLLRPPASSPLSDGVATTTADPFNVNVKNIFPENSSGSEKLLQKVQSDRVVFLEKSNAEKEKDFAKERQKFMDEIMSLNNKIVELNIELNKKNAEMQVLEMNSKIELNTKDAQIKAFEMRHEENKTRIDKLMDRIELAREQEYEPEQKGGLADRIDTMMGDGTSTMMLGKLAEGAGTGIGKLIEFGIEYFSKKKGDKTEPPPEINPQNTLQSGQIRAMTPEQREQKKIELEEEIDNYLNK